MLKKLLSFIEKPSNQGITRPRRAHNLSLKAIVPEHLNISPETTINTMISRGILDIINHQLKLFKNSYAYNGLAAVVNLLDYMESKKKAITKNNIEEIYNEFFESKDISTRQTLKLHSGNCLGLSGAFVETLRSKGIPAYISYEAKKEYHAGPSESFINHAAVIVPWSDGLLYIDVMDPTHAIILKPGGSNSYYNGNARNDLTLSPGMEYIDREYSWDNNGRREGLSMTVHLENIKNAGGYINKLYVTKEKVEKQYHLISYYNGQIKNIVSVDVKKGRIMLQKGSDYYAERKFISFDTWKQKGNTENLERDLDLPMDFFSSFKSAPALIYAMINKIIDHKDRLMMLYELRENI